MTQYLNTLQKGWVRRRHVTSSYLFIFIGSQLDVSDPDGTFSESVLDGALSLCLVGAGTGEGTARRRPAGYLSLFLLSKGSLRWRSLFVGFLKETMIL